MNKVGSTLKGNAAGAVARVPQVAPKPNLGTKGPQLLKASVRLGTFHGTKPLVGVCLLVFYRWQPLVMVTFVVDMLFNADHYISPAYLSSSGLPLKDVAFSPRFDHVDTISTDDDHQFRWRAIFDISSISMLLMQDTPPITFESDQIRWNRARAIPSSRNWRNTMVMHLIHGKDPILLPD